MFQLIVTVIAIALTSALALASFHYGGSILSNATVTTSVATLLNDAQQISNAVVLDQLDNPYQPISLDRIPSIPIPPRVADAGATWQVDPAGITYIRLRQDASSKVCAQVQQMGGFEDPIGWNDASSVASTLRAAGRLFGCVGNAGQSYFAYRLN